MRREGAFDAHALIVVSTNVMFSARLFPLCICIMGFPVLTPLKLLLVPTESRSAQAFGELG